MTHDRIRLLVPTAGRQPAREMADAVVRIAVSLGADIVPLHIVREGETEATALKGPLVLAEAAREAGVNAIPATRQGQIVDAIIDTAERFDVSLIVMGVSEGRVVDEWVSADVMHHCQVPVVCVPVSVPPPKPRDT
jgi:nucleotide-binding universal stress UspA family protein